MVWAKGEGWVSGRWFGVTRTHAPIQPYSNWIEPTSSAKRSALSFQLSLCFNFPAASLSLCLSRLVIEMNMEIKTSSKKAPQVTHQNRETSEAKGMI